jgi:predicted negative regulator of RcsB-dependent stress response
VDENMNEKEQWEELKAWLRENSVWIVAGVLVGAGGVGGWRLYQERVERLAHEASEKYQQLLGALNGNDRTRATAIVSELGREHVGSSYLDQAQLAMARAAVDAGDFARAHGLLEAIMKSSKDPELALVARLRLARVQIAEGKVDDALATLRSADAAGEFAPRFAEVRGDALLAKGDRKGALEAYREASAAKTPGVVDPDTLDLKTRDLASQ